MLDCRKDRIAISVVAALAVPMSSEAADEAFGPQQETGREDSYSVLLSQDSFFGFYPSFNGLIPMSEDVDFSFYGILWTRDTFGNAAGSGDDLWTEFGLGINYHALDGALTIKPQIGVTNGSLLSGGERNEAGETVGAAVGDGIVPSLTINYSGDRFEAEWYSGYYAALRQRGDDAALDFLHLWANAGYKVTDRFSVGGHYELLQNSRNNFPGGSAGVTYEWLGPYAQFSLNNGFFARFTAGAEIQDNSEGDFYKLTTGFGF